MFVRKVKRKCNVRGCRNTDCFSISHTREAGNSVIICKDCLSSALIATDEIDPKTKSNIPEIKNTTAPSLFFNAEALGFVSTDDVTEPYAEAEEQTEDETDVEAEERTEDETDVENENDSFTDEVFMCPTCAKTFDSLKGLQTHRRYCKSDKVDE